MSESILCLRLEPKKLSLAAYFPDYGRIDLSETWGRFPLRLPDFPVNIPLLPNSSPGTHFLLTASQRSVIAA